MKQQINYDIAWQIFDGVNKHYDTEKYIDLNCLDIIDSQAIAKQKILDAATELTKQIEKGRSRAPSDIVMSVLAI